MTKNKEKKTQKKIKCKAKTKAGKQCKNRAIIRSSFCGRHQKKTGIKNIRCVIQQVSSDTLKDDINSLLKKTFFWKYLELERKKTSLSKKDFSICIKIDIDVFVEHSSTGTCPTIIETFIEVLHDHGYLLVLVADSTGASSQWLENRDVLIVADLIGYSFQTSKGIPYDIVNLNEDCDDNIFPKSHFMNSFQLSKFWSEANFRISFAKNKTDDEFGYNLCLKSLINILPLRDKDYHYMYCHDPAELAFELLKNVPVHFSFIDGVISNHGSQGIRYSKPITTNILIGSADLLLTDWVGALKMGVDPYISSINSYALKNKGLPKQYDLVGDLSPYTNWENVHQRIIHSVNNRNKSFAMRKILRPWLTTVNRDFFPFKNSLDDHLNGIITEIINNETDSKRSELLLMIINYIIALFSGIFSSYTIIMDKDRIQRQEKNIGFDYSAFTRDDYENIENYMTQYAIIAKNCIPDKNGLRWCYIDKSVLFVCEKLLPIPYKDFIKKVNICLAVQMMNDNIGGSNMPVEYDSKKRVRYQVERDIYLPQPNWMSVFGGDFIDVGKIEYIKYKKNSQTMFWKSVASENSSTIYDDGIVSFENASEGTTKITIVARQLFAIPLLWQMIDLDLVPEFKKEIISNSYIFFFSRTIANYEAMYEGRKVKTGYEYDPNYGEDEYGNNNWMNAFSNRFSGFIEPVLSWLTQSIMNPDLEKILSSVIGSQWDEKIKPLTSNKSFTPLGDLFKTFISDLMSAAQKDAQFWSRSSQKEMG